MLYLLAIICPPIAVLFAGKPFQAFINFLLTLCVWIPGVIHAILVVNEKKADKRAVKQAKLIAKMNKE
ncbi:YqaE/Pmp3 family membrane protein [Heyndrickxia sp. FSL K6-6286]|uniref:YqaE/Pmp3 family membrane protein n=1 Tax=Heyndrickxia sp. FSL K6-6286 TaxID=2921510 RepID=UPI00039D1380|nr:YqaE/Pmp3 family membrane protein [Heyndrickxia oleronia]